MNREHKEILKLEFAHVDTIYFNTAYFGPSPYRAKLKVSKALAKELDPSFRVYNAWMGVAERLREQIAEFLNVSPDNICHSTSASDLLNLVIAGLKFNSDDWACAINRDYPSNVLPWMLAQKRRGINFKLLELDQQVVPNRKWLEEVLPPKTKILTLSHVAFETGKRVPILEIGKLCQERGILFYVDATQSLGGIEITEEEMKYIDIIACASYKWMLGPYGHAFAYFSNKAIEQVEYQNANWLKNPANKDITSLLDYSIETFPGARKYDRGQVSNFLTNSCMEAGLEVFKEVGVANIEKHNASLRDYFLQNYPQKKYSLITPTEYMANIICLKANGIDPIELERELKRRNVDVSVRQGNIRLSFHLFNTNEQIDQLIIALDI